MNWVEQAVQNYLVPAPLSPSNLELGGGPSFSAELERARVRTRTGFWLCVLMLLVLFVADLFVLLRYFDQLVLLGAGGMTAASGAFGASAAGCVTMMMRWVRETGRAELLLVLLRDLYRRNPTVFDDIVRNLADDWYGLTTSHKDADKPATTATEGQASFFK